MIFETTSDLLAMNGHGLYVWSVYAIGVAVIAYNVVAPWQAKRRVGQKINRLKRLQHAQQRAGGQS